MINSSSTELVIKLNYKITNTIIHVPDLWFSSCRWCRRSRTLIDTMMTSLTWVTHSVTDLSESVPHWLTRDCVTHVTVSVTHSLSLWLSLSHCQCHTHCHWLGEWQCHSPSGSLVTVCQPVCQWLADCVIWANPKLNWPRSPISVQTVCNSEHGISPQLKVPAMEIGSSSAAKWKPLIASMLWLRTRAQALWNFQQ